MQQVLQLIDKADLLVRTGQYGQAVAEYDIAEARLNSDQLKVDDRFTAEDGGPSFWKIWIASRRSLAQVLAGRIIL